MEIKVEEKNKALELRAKGFSYSEILRQVPVAKSTLSLWLRSVGLSQKQKQRLTDKKRAAMERGWRARENWRIEKTRTIVEESKKEIDSITIDTEKLWVMGIMLYWA